MDRQLIHEIIELSIKAGEQILDIYNSEFAITHKEDNSPLTEADMAAHHTIVEGLATITPNIPVLSEEAASIPFSERSSWNRYWLVDPLDGTREFIKRNGEFTVNIALIEDHKAVMGVVYTPVGKLTYFAQSGGGAFRQADNEQAVPIHTRSKPENHTIVAGSRSHRGESLNNFLSRLSDYEIISMGSSLKSCLVAEGSADIYPRFGPTSECIVEEAGGAITTIDMNPLRYNTKDSLLNPHFVVIGDTEYNWSELLD